MTRNQRSRSAKCAVPIPRTIRACHRLGSSTTVRCLDGNDPANVLVERRLWDAPAAAELGGSYLPYVDQVQDGCAIRLQDVGGLFHGVGLHVFPSDNHKRSAKHIWVANDLAITLDVLTHARTTQAPLPFPHSKPSRCRGEWTVSQIDVFFRDCIAGLRRIASATRGDASLDDVKNEAWVMAHDLAAKGEPLDLASPADQDSMLGKLYGKFVLRMRTCIGLALRLDKDWDKGDDDAGPRLYDTVKGPELFDPAHALEEKEAPTALEACRLRSYSQATAYAICLHRWPDASSLAGYLAIKLETLNVRIRHWRAWIAYQPSLFDGIERIGLDFRPLPGIPSAPEGIADSGDESQQSWDF